MSIDYKKRMEQIKPYVDFYFKSKKLNRQQKTLISKYHILIFGGNRRIGKERKYVPGLIKGSPKVFRPRNKKNLQIAKKARRLTKYTHLKVVFTGKGKNTKIKIKNNKFILSNNNIDSFSVLFDPDKLAINAKKEVKRVLKNYPDKIYGIIAGEHELLRSTTSIKECAEKVEELQNNYDNQDLNNYWGNWLDGVIVYETKNQKAVHDLYVERAEARKASNLRFRRLDTINKKENEIFHLNKLLSRTKDEKKKRKTNSKLERLKKSVIKLRELIRSK